MKDKKFVPFWMEKEKIEIIEAYAECIHNGEVLLERIEKAVEYIKENESVDLYDDVGSEFIRNLLNILRGEEKENG